MKCYTDRELSWLSFNDRVLSEADDNRTPVLERLNFLKIYYSNLDEFFMVRVGSLVHRKVLMPNYKDPKTGWDNQTQMRKILRVVSEQQKKAKGVYTHLLYDLKACGVEIVDFAHISKLDESIGKKLFAEVRDQLSFRIVDDGHPMQFLGNCESYVGACLQKGEKRLMGTISLFRIPQFRVYDNNGVQKVFIMSELIRYFCKSVFKGYDVTESCVMRVTRNADVFIEEEAQSAASGEKMAKLIKKRKRQLPVRLQLDCKVSDAFKQLLMTNVGVTERMIFVSSVPYDLGFRSELGSRPALRYKAAKSVRKVDLARGEYFSYIRKHDLLLSYPFNTMHSFIDLLYEAASDPRVRSIKITLYRLAMSSQVAMALAYAADRGKKVDCVLELRARFDEKNNIDYSEMLTDAGCRVVYGLPDYKVHSKLCLITLDGPSSGSADNPGFEYITQVGTGNYNEITSELYTDLSLITADRQIGLDAEKIFDALLEGSVPPLTEKLITAPEGFKPGLLALLDCEKEKGFAGRVSIKVNAINDLEVMEKLVECSNAGVRVELFVRGICCIKPGVEGCTENLTVKSVVGRYLEHSRIYVFGDPEGPSGGDAKIFIGSGDLLSRNTERRVECFIPVEAPSARTDVLRIMEAFRADNERSWIMQPDGSYTRPLTSDKPSCQKVLYEYFTNPEASKPEAHTSSKRGASSKVAEPAAKAAPADTAKAADPGIAGVAGSSQPKQPAPDETPAKKEPSALRKALRFLFGKK